MKTQFYTWDEARKTLKFQGLFLNWYENCMVSDRYVRGVITTWEWNSDCIEIGFRKIRWVNYQPSEIGNRNINKIFFDHRQSGGVTLHRHRIEWGTSYWQCFSASTDERHLDAGSKFLEKRTRRGVERFINFLSARS